jgi:hypothetical protein
MTAQQIQGADPQAKQHAREAAIEAGETFDRREPGMSLNQWLQSKEGKAYR